MWGKEKLGPILRKQGYPTSNATVGRIIGALIRRGTVQPVPALIRKVAAKAAPKKRPHAIRKPKGVTFEKPGDVVQIDTLSIYPLPGVSIKHFNAYDPFAKWTVARPCKRATAKNAAEFLDAVLEQMPDPLKAIQIDGGSEFMAEFEQACADKNLPLYVLPPRSPKLNGAVERCNGAWRYEFYACADLPTRIDKIAQMVGAFQNLYNHHRPHAALAGKPQPSTSLSAEPTKLPRLICPEPGHCLDVVAARDVTFCAVCAHDPAAAWRGRKRSPPHEIARRSQGAAKAPGRGLGRRLKKIDRFLAKPAGVRWIQKS